MSTLKTATLAAILAAGLTACEIFEDPTPETVSVFMEGPAGTDVMGIYSKVFVTARDEIGTTQVEIDRADTVIHRFPIDTIVDIRLERQIFVQVQPMTGDTLTVTVRVDIDDDNDIQQTGLILPETPFRYLFQFNRPRAQSLDVVF